jgi:molybdenum cofactor biosynthesis enzyme MoaA
MTTHSSNGPNFSIIVPGNCNGHCSFCFWKKTECCPDYLDKLKEILDSMPPEFKQISLTGGEPCMSSYLKDILKLIDKEQYPKVVLTTNGTNLYNTLGDIAEIKIIDHINISRHHYIDGVNKKIFNSSAIINSSELLDVIELAHQKEIDVTLNCVLTDFLYSKSALIMFINYAKSLGADAVCFRKQHGTLEASKQESLFEQYPVMGTGGCPVCRTKLQKINGVNVFWKASCSEPSKELGEMYEAIMHPDGKVTLDWAGEIEMKSMKDIALDKIGDALMAI